jgi:hypothetical protein
MSRETYWQEHMQAWESGELSQRDYCQAHDLKFHTFQYWRSRLNKPDKPVESSFKPVKINHQPSAIKMLLPNGILLEAGCSEIAELLSLIQVQGLFNAPA